MVFLLLWTLYQGNHRVKTSSFIPLRALLINNSKNNEVVTCYKLICLETTRVNLQSTMQQSLLFIIFSHESLFVPAFL